jgi:hypothetical protein
MQKDGKPASLIKKKQRVTGRPYIKLDDDVLDQKIKSMKHQYSVASSRLVILNDRIAKHEHEKTCRTHDALVQATNEEEGTENESN